MKKYSISFKAFVVTALMAFLSACGSSGLEVIAKFANTSDIKEGTVVLFNSQAAGKVTDVESAGNGSLVTINFDAELAQQISAHSAVVVNRLLEGAPLEIYNRRPVQDNPLQPGQQLKGLDSMFQLGAWMLGDAIQLGANSVSQYLDAFQDYLQSEKFQQDKVVMQDKLGEVTVAAKVALQQVETDLNEAVIEINGEEKSASEALEQLGTELQPLARELGKSGSELMAELQKFTEGLQETQFEQQQAGEQFLESLLATIEKLNKSLEEGAASARAQNESNWSNEEHE